MLHEVDEFIQKRRTTWQNTDDPCASMRPTRPQRSSTAAARLPAAHIWSDLNEWKEFEEHISHYGKHHDDGVNGGLIRWLNKSRAEVGGSRKSQEEDFPEALHRPSPPASPHHTAAGVGAAAGSTRTSGGGYCCGPTHDELHGFQAQARERSSSNAGCAADGDVELAVLPEGSASEVAEDRDGPESSSGADHGRRPARLTAQATTPDLLSSFGG